MCLEYYILFETHFTRKKTVYQISKKKLSLSILEKSRTDAHLYIIGCIYPIILYT